MPDLVTAELEKKFLVLEECAKQINVPQDALEDVFDMQSVEGLKNHKCFVRCLFQRFDMDMWVRLHKLWDAALKNKELEIYSSDALLNATTHFGDTAMHIAASAGSLKAVKALVTKGAYIEALDRNGLTPLYKAIQANETDTAKYLLSSGAFTGGVDHTQMNMLHWASRHGMTEIIELLLMKSEVLTVDSGEESDVTPLSLACKFGHLRAVRALLNLGANPNFKDIYLWTPLHQAAFWGELKIVQLLVLSGAEMNAMTKDQKTALQLAYCNGHTAIYEYLRINGGL